MRRHFTDANFELVEEMERIGQGHGKTVGHVALAWHLSNPLITAPILGARNAAQLEESLGAAGFRLQEEEMSRLNAPTEWRQD
jgi:aryl-alcohol dehydrogenase-like predicted oxidoreductase